MDNSDREALKQMVDDYSLMGVLMELEEYCRTTAKEYEAEDEEYTGNAARWRADATLLQRAIASRNNPS